ncbi:alpha/beta fold hydrolase [Kribbella sp. NPDC056345]|uniref:alpha/beta fold hydrolase n=1 Tax=Kribbella sp. NPDC056345 TaxID=3345789 RepID=UPI0035DB6EDB
MLAPASLIMSAATRLTQLRGCVHHRQATVAGYTFHYYEGGSGDPLVLLHGLADDKNSFLASAAKLTSKFRVILPDLAGHGDNEQAADRDYSVRGHVEALHGLFGELGLDRFHLGGNSMGGHTSAAYALRYPEQIASLILVNAPGAGKDTRPIYAGFGARMKTVEDFGAVLDRVYYQKPKLPGFIVQHMLNEMDKRFDHVNAMTQAVRDGEDLDLADRIAAITQRTLVLWGKHDIVVPFDVAEAYTKKIPNAHLRRLDNAAHSPQLEIPGPVANEIETFLTTPPA